MYLDSALLLGSILKTKSPSMWVHEVLDPQNNPVRLEEESMELASALLKTHLSGVKSLVMVSISCSEPLLGGA